MTPLELVVARAAAGRGLWIGAFEATGLHVTLAHLGKKKDGSRAERAAEACQRVAAQHGKPIKAQTWGQARLDQYAGCVSVLLLESADLYILRTRIVEELWKQAVQTDRSFAFHPHLTVARHGKDEPVTLLRRARQSVVFPALSLVCGAEPVDYPLGPA